MSPIIARAAIRATRTAGQNRQFSVMRTMRNVARSFEPHPFQRLPNAGTPQKADWSKLVKRSAGQAMIYFPGFGFILGWPYLAKVGLDGRM
ncbi:hypothetical protein M406DRAFT_358238 [Cryphonectria parasitica EP155]|uniref:Pantothenate transporter liz1 n=1 Tax=Cryphonectria parasitica (strain ATCC 38755 / EP155) TaxID=660469 RepID=A0A9P5CK46_CRYP1|nr:uncharacterized protein M406DRAFT_358238 [Cryphonectria parasitica EP155]KAF3760581.1 hypothetical protein M406DRAFT_358238 [Cryphonectria parasitica EP155]